MGGVNAEVARLFAAKAARRKALSGLPFEEKVRAVIKLQEMAAPILRTRGQAVCVWEDSATTSTGPKATPTKS